jgi:hypothetical protein
MITAPGLKGAPDACYSPSRKITSANPLAKAMKPIKTLALQAEFYIIAVIIGTPDHSQICPITQ